MVYIIPLAIGFHLSCNPPENRVCFPVILNIVKMGKCSNYAISAAAVFLAVPCASIEHGPFFMYLKILKGGNAHTGGVPSFKLNSTLITGICFMRTLFKKISQ